MSAAEYIKETRAELKRVNWPVRRQVAAFTFAVVVVSVLMSLLLGVFDLAFSTALGKLLLGREGAPVVAPATGEGDPAGVGNVITIGGDTATDAANNAGGSAAPLPGGSPFPSAVLPGGGTVPMLPN